MQTMYENGFRKSSEITRFLFATNIVTNDCLPNFEKLQNVFSQYSTGKHKVLIFPLKNKPFVNVVFNSADDALSAFNALNKKPCKDYYNLRMHIEYSEPRNVSNVSLNALVFYFIFHIFLIFCLIESF